MGVVNPLSIMPATRSAFGQWIAPDGGGTFGSTAWQVASGAVAYPIVIGAYTVSFAIVPIIVTSGNLDVGIYDANMARVASLGSTPVGGTGLRTFALSATLGGGTYWLAMSIDNITAQVRTGPGQLGRFAVLTMAAAFPLPATFVPALPSATTVTPMFGVSRTSAL